MTPTAPGWKRLNQFADLAFPIATALLLLNQSILANGLLGAWLLCRLVREAQTQPLNWLLLGLALTNLGTIVLDRGAKPSDPSDFLVIVLAFAAGLQRSADQWRQSLMQISACLLPIAIAAVAKPAGMLLQFPEINVNRMGFLLGLLTMVSWGLLQMAQNRREQIGWLAVTGLSLGLTLPTESRAALAIPALSAALAAILMASKSKWPTTRPKHSWIRVLLVLILLALISTGSVLTWYRVGPAASENKISDVWRIETSLCWAKAPIQQGQILFGLGHNENVRKLCRGNRLKSLEAAVDSSDLSDDQRNAGKVKAARGLPHAHNVFAQIFAETGLAGLSATMVACGWIARRILHTLNRHNQQQQPADRLITGLLLPLFLYLLTSSLITNFHIYLLLNQLAIGYLLGSLNATDADRATAA